MNVYKCTSKKDLNLHCIYQQIDIDEESGELTEKGCTICKSDHYNIYPEFNKSSGDVIFQIPILKTKEGKFLLNTEPIPLGRSLIWENHSGQNQNGLSFDYRDFNPYDHPGYHLVEHHVPTKCGSLTPDTIADIFGEENLTLVTSGWDIDKSYGKENVEYCTLGLYGKFNIQSGIVIHRSMKNYMTDVLGWKNYTIFNDKTKVKRLFLMEASNEIIYLYCKEKFEDLTTIRNMTEIMIAIREGEYINLKTAALNNKVPFLIANSITKEISFQSKETIYKGTVNIQKLYELYEYISRLKLDDEYVKMYRINIINYLLNYDTLSKTIFAFTEFETNQRYWFLYLLLKKAYNRDKLINPAYLPEWARIQINEIKKRVPTFKVLGKVYNVTNCPNEIWDIITEMYSYQLETPDELFPAITRIQDIIDLSNTSKEKKKIFYNILKAGVKWNISEVQTVWAKFTRFYDKNKPRQFWNFIDEMDELDYDILINRTEGDGNPGLKKICFTNLLNARTNFRNQNNWEVEIPQLVQGIASGAKHKAKFKQRKKHFWNELMRMGGLAGDKKFVTSDIEDALIEREQLKDELLEETGAPSNDLTLDSDEYYRFSDFDPTTGIYNPMINRGGSEENWIEGASNE